jgi:hypothetical protein
MSEPTKEVPGDEPEEEEDAPGETQGDAMEKEPEPVQKAVEDITKKAVFEVDREEFRTFVESVRCKGILNVDDEKVKQGNLFNDLLLAVTKDGLFVKATDSKQNKVIAQHFYRTFDKDNRPKGAVIVSEGEIPITSIENALKAVDLCTSGKSDVITVAYPDNEGMVFIGSKGTDTGWSFITKGRKDLSCLAKVDEINHVWVPETRQVKSTSKQSGQVLFWETRLTVLPEEITKVATDMKDFVKQKVVWLRINNGKVIFSLGTANASRKGKRELLDYSRQKFDGKQWVNVAATDKLVDIEGSYCHGFYAVLQNIPLKNNLELYFHKFPKDKVGGLMDMCWVRSYSATMELHFCIPFEVESK